MLKIVITYLLILCVRNEFIIGYTFLASIDNLKIFRSFLIILQLGMSRVIE